MLTYTHAIIGHLLFYKKENQKNTLSTIGAITPDIILGVGFLFHFLGDSYIVNLLHELFHFSYLHTITEMMHSFTIVIPLLILSYFFYSKSTPFFVGMLSHVFIDLITHQQMLYNHFMPIPIPMFSGPFSYTNVYFSIFEHLFVIGFLSYIAYKNWKNIMRYLSNKFSNKNDN